MKIHEHNSKQRICTAHSMWAFQKVEYPMKGRVSPEDKRVTVFQSSPDVYSGQLWKGQKDGYGVTLYTNGDAYAGI